MAEKALQLQLLKYNEKVQNTYKNNWGSVLTFLGGQDTDSMAIKANRAVFGQTDDGTEIPNASTSTLKQRNSSGRQQSRGSQSKFRQRKQPQVIARNAVNFWDQNEQSGCHLVGRAEGSAAAGVQITDNCENINFQISKEQEAPFEQPQGFKTARQAAACLNQQDFTIDIKDQEKSQYQTTSREQLSKALHIHEISATLPNSSLETPNDNTAAIAKTNLSNILQFSREKQVQSQFNSGRQISMLHNNLTSAQTQVNSIPHTFSSDHDSHSRRQLQGRGPSRPQNISAVNPRNKQQAIQMHKDQKIPGFGGLEGFRAIERRPQETSTSLGYQSSIREESFRQRVSNMEVRGPNGLRRPIHEMMEGKHQASVQFVRDCMLREQERNRSMMETGREAPGYQSESIRNLGTELLLSQSGGLHISDSLLVAPSPPAETSNNLGYKKLEAVKEIFTPEPQAPSEKNGMKHSDSEHKRSSIDGISLSHSGGARWKNNQILQQAQPTASFDFQKSFGSGPGEKEPGRRNMNLYSESTRVIPQSIQVAKTPQNYNGMSVKKSHQQITRTHLGSLQLSPQAEQSRRLQSQVDFQPKTTKYKAQKSQGLKYQPGMLFGNDKTKYFQNGGHFKYNPDELIQTFFNPRKDIIKETLEQSKQLQKYSQESTDIRNRHLTSKAYRQFARSIPVKYQSERQRNQAGGADSGQLQLSGSLDPKDTPNDSKLVDEILQLPKDYRSLQRSMAGVAARVVARQDPERTTAFGFPSIHFQDPEDKRRLRVQAGAPQDNLTSVTGEVMRHTRQIENETLVTKNNPIQYCVKLYDYEEKKSEQLANGGKAKGGGQRDGFGKKSSTTTGQTKVVFDFQPYDIVKLSENMHEVAKFSQDNCPRVFPSRPEEMVIFQTKKRLLNDTVSKKNIELHQRQQRADYAIGARRKFGDEFAKTGPVQYLSNQRQEKWLQSRAPISEEQQQQMRRRKALGSVGGGEEEMGDCQGKEKGERQLSAKALQKKQLQLAQELFMIWDGDGEGSLSADELMKAFIQIGLSQDPRFARKIMQNIQPQKKHGKGKGAAGNQDEAEDEEQQDIKLKDFIRIFKKDEISEHLVKVINEHVILKRKIEILKASKHLQQGNTVQQSIHKNHVTDINIKKLQSEVSKMDYLSLSEDINQDLPVVAQEKIVEGDSHAASKDQEQQRIVAAADVARQRQNNSSILNKSLMSTTSYRVESLSHNMTLFNKKFAEQITQTIKKDGDHEQNKSLSQENIKVEEGEEVTVAMKAPKTTSQVNFWPHSTHRSTDPTHKEGPSSSNHQQAHEPHTKSDFYKTLAKNKWQKLGADGLVQRRAEIMKTPTLGEQNDVISEWWRSIVNSYVKDLKKETVAKVSHEAQKVPRNAEGATHSEQVEALTDEVPLAKVYYLLVKKRLVSDEQGAISLVHSYIGLSNLQTPGKMCQDEFCKLFSKGQFKTTLINTLEKLQQNPDKKAHGQVVVGRKSPKSPPAGILNITKNSRKEAQNQSVAAPKSSQSLLDRVAESLRQSVAERKIIDQDARQNYFKEIPLSLKIERYQRQKLLQGLKPERDSEQREQLKYLQSLKHIQRWGRRNVGGGGGGAEAVDEVTQYLRERQYEEFVKDPLGSKFREEMREERELSLTDQFNKRIDFIQLESEIKEGFKEWQDYNEQEKKQLKQQSYLKANEIE